jgi:hypothetical protein
LSITVFSDNAAASAMFNTGSISNLGNTQVQLPGSGVNVAGNVYEVDGDGMIFFPQIGKLKLEGLTKDGITALLNNKLSNKYLTNPYYVINFLNLNLFKNIQTSYLLFHFHFCLFLLSEDFHLKKGFLQVQLNTLLFLCLSALFPAFYFGTKI